MTYLMVKWKHSFLNEPCVMYSELDDALMERRKIEVYRDGRWGFADEHEEVGGTMLGEVPIPTVDSLNADPEFEAEMIDEEEFGKLWIARRTARIMTPVPLGNRDAEPG